MPQQPLRDPVSPTSWLRPENASVLDEPWQKAVRQIAELLGATDPQSQVMGIAGAMEGGAKRALRIPGGPRHWGPFTENLRDPSMRPDWKGSGKGFATENYPASAKVDVKFSDMDAFDDEIKGMNPGHARYRAQQNWPGAQSIGVTGTTPHTPSLEFRLEQMLREAMLKQLGKR